MTTDILDDASAVALALPGVRLPEDDHDGRAVLHAAMAQIVAMQAEIIRLRRYRTWVQELAPGVHAAAMRELERTRP